mmetsp:Transcript_39112/g.59656  ORF Transcript_39112/g.59656 Transcript_39112/m.59656 type:complete len:250 (+) Transcript_39112:1258-2007(+)
MLLSERQLLVLLDIVSGFSGREHRVDSTEEPNVSNQIEENGAALQGPGRSLNLVISFTDFLLDGRLTGDGGQASGLLLLLGNLLLSGSRVLVTPSISAAVVRRAVMVRGWPVVVVRRRSVVVVRRGAVVVRRGRSMEMRRPVMVRRGSMMVMRRRSMVMRRRPMTARASHMRRRSMRMMMSMVSMMMRRMVVVLLLILNFLLNRLLDRLLHRNLDRLLDNRLLPWLSRLLRNPRSTDPGEVWILIVHNY